MIGAQVIGQPLFFQGSIGVIYILCVWSVVGRKWWPPDL